MAELAKEQARAQAWEMLLEKAREAYQADPKAGAAAKTLLKDPAWKQAIQADVTAKPGPTTQEEVTAAAVAGSWSPETAPRMEWTIKYPGYRNGELLIEGDDFNASNIFNVDEIEKTLTCESITWGSAQG
jgi:hypothetical protein